MTQAAAHPHPSTVVNAARAAQRGSAAAGSGPVPARANEDHAEVTVRAAVAAERVRIARDLDDAAGKSLLSVAMVADSLASPLRSADPHVLDNQLRELAWLARQAVTLARSVINGLHDDALGDAVRSVATVGGVAEVSVGLAARASKTSEVIRREIVGILREALLAAEQPAQASGAQVWLRTAGGLLLTMAGDGIGFCPTDPEFRPVTHGSMREHARSLDGDPITSPWRRRETPVDVRIPEPEMARQLRAVPSAPPVRVVIADSNPVLRAGLRSVLDNAPTTTVVAEAANTQDAVQQVQRHYADVLLIDAWMALPDGLATIRQLGQLTPVVMLDWTDDSGLGMRAVPAGDSSYAVHGQLEPGELIRVVLDGARGNPGTSRHPDPFLTDRLLAHERAERSNLADLRPREREIMQFIAEGLSNRQIAARLVISEKTVKNHICSIYQRLGVHGRSQAISRWRDQ
jgi:DNA-binding NarL/FixJ family response regulator